MTFLLITASIYGGVEVLALLFQRLTANRPPGADAPATLTLTPTDNTVLLAAALICAAIICRGLPVWWAAPFGIYLLFSALMDAQTMQVYDAVQMAAIGWQLVALLQIVLTRHPDLLTLLLSLTGYAAFLMVQLWQHCYGLADTMAFSACGLFIINTVLVGSGSTLVIEALAYLLALANGLFLITNLCNLSRGLQLKQRVAFIPAIALATILLANALT